MVIAAHTLRCGDRGLAATFLKERIAPLQWTGIAAILLGVVLMNF
jgi:drug/metabolite transporter (DMT)-like permease